MRPTLSVAEVKLSLIQVYYLWNEIGRIFGWSPWRLESLQKMPRALKSAVHEIACGRDATFDVDDALPFLGLHGVQLPVQLLRIVRNGTPWLKLDLCSGKVVELGGD